MRGPGDEAAEVASRPRRGVVLGAGGVLGAAWMVGALCALEEETGVDATDVDLLLGTSAGSVVAAMLAAGVSPTDQYAHQRGAVRTDGPLANIEFDYAGSGVRPPAPRPGLGSTRLLAAAARDRQLLSGPVLLAGVLPRGRGSIETVVELVDKVVPTWPRRTDLRLVAMDYHTGERAVFGRMPADGPPSDPPDAVRDGMRPAQAVAASCAIPGWFTPVESDGRTFVDGGAVSIASADLAAGQDLDEVFVLAPLAWTAPLPARPSFGRRLLERWRRPQTLQLLREIEVLRQAGTKVTVLTPSTTDLVALGMNPMNPQRRLDVLETALRSTREALGEARASG